MSAQTIEERLTDVEAELQQLKQEKEQNKEQNKEAEEPRGWQRIVGRFADNPLFEDAVRQGRKWRESEDPLDAEEAS